LKSLLLSQLGSICHFADRSLDVMPALVAGIHVFTTAMTWRTPSLNSLRFVRMGLFCCSADLLSSPFIPALVAAMTRAGAPRRRAAAVAGAGRNSPSSWFAA
jgi:hypothetical protein